MTRNVKLGLALALGLSGLGAGSVAALTIEFDINGDGVDASFSTVGTEYNLADYAIGGWTFDTFKATSFDFTDSSRLSSTTAELTGGSQSDFLVVKVYDDGYTGGAYVGTSGLQFSVAGSSLGSGSTVSADGWIDGLQVGSTIIATSGDEAGWFEKYTDSRVLNDPFGMMQVITFSGTTSGLTQFVATLTAEVPLPAGGLLLLSALGGLGLARRRRSPEPAIA